MTDLSDALVLTSSIDTVVTLHQNQRGKNLRTDNDDCDGETASCFVMKSRYTRREATVQVATSNVRDDDNQSSNFSSNNNNDIETTISHENILMKSIWHAEIRERGVEEYCKSFDHLESETNDLLLVDYAIVESFVKKDGIPSFGEYKGKTELRWKH